RPVTAPPLLDGRRFRGYPCRIKFGNREERAIAAYLMVQMTVSDPAQYRVYSKAVVPLIEKHGGKFIIRGGKVQPLEGRRDGRRMVVFRVSVHGSAQGLLELSGIYPGEETARDAAVLAVWAAEGV